MCPLEPLALAYDLSPPWISCVCPSLCVHNMTSFLCAAVSSRAGKTLVAAPGSSVTLGVPGGHCTLGVGRLCLLFLYSVPADQGPQLHNLVLVAPPPPHPLSPAFIPQVNHSQLKEASTQFSLAAAALPLGSPPRPGLWSPFHLLPHPASPYSGFRSHFLQDLLLPSQDRVNCLS